VRPKENVELAGGAPRARCAAAAAARLLAAQLLRGAPRGACGGDGVCVERRGARGGARRQRRQRRRSRGSRRRDLDVQRQLRRGGGVGRILSQPKRDALLRRSSSAATLLCC
jgi:hypothetical protein